MVTAFRNGADGTAGLTLGSPLPSELDGDRFLSYVSVFDFLGLLASYASYGSFLVLAYRLDDRARSSQAGDEASRRLSATGFAGGEGPEKNR